MAVSEDREDKRGTGNIEKEAQDLVREVKVKIN